MSKASGFSKNSETFESCLKDEPISLSCLAVSSSRREISGTFGADIYSCAKLMSMDDTSESYPNDEPIFLICLKVSSSKRVA